MSKIVERKNRLVNWPSGLCSIFLLVLLGVAVSCRQTASDRSHLTGDPCLLPCWHGIEPGVQEAKVVAIADNRSFWEDPARRLERDSLIVYHLYAPGTHAAVLLSDNEVVSISLNTKPPTTLHEMVTVYDAPDFLVVLGGQYEYAVYGYYLDVGMLFWALSSQQDHTIDGKFEVYPQLVLEGIEVFAPTDSLEKAVEGGSNKFAYLQATPELRREWKGYGYYEP
jgi:hypothetical protein